MPRVILTLTLAAFATTHLYAQAAPQFEVATIKPAPPQAEGRTSTRMSSDTDKGQLTYSNVNLKQLIAKAYKLKEFQINGPDLLDNIRFDVAARFPPKSQAEDLALMLQALLADRFHLTVHRETKELPIYALTVTPEGPKFKAIEKDTGISSNSNRTGHHAAAKVTLERFAEYLTSQVGRPVFDKTGLSGAYEMTLDWALDGASGSDNSPALPSIFTALQEQLGLKLQSAKGPVEMIIVNSVDRTPTEN